MRLKQYLQELFLAGFNNPGYIDKGGYYEIFTNPSKSELKDAAKQSQGRLVGDLPGMNVRFVADIKTKKVYAWATNVFHSDAIKQIGKEIKGYARF